MSNAVEVLEGQVVPIVPQTSEVVRTNPMAMLQVAVARGDTQLAERLMDLHDRWEKAEARREFDAAIAAAKAEIPVIRKNKRVTFESKKVGAAATDYAHEDMAEIAETINPILGKYGLSYRFRTTSNPNEPVTVTCIISHRKGHFEENTLVAGRDDSGNKNSIQAIGSTVTYLQRYTLKAALGLAASEDDDGAKAGPVETITQEQADTIRDALEAAGKDRTKFLAWAKVAKIEDIPADLYQSCLDAAKFKAGAPK